MPTALITGVSGQDGSYLAELLLEKGYEVHGLIRSGLGSAAHLEDRVTVHRGDLTDSASLRGAIEAAAPDEVYHLASPTRPGHSWDHPGATFDAVAGGTARLLDGVATVAPQARVFWAGSSEMFAAAAESPQTEKTAPAARSPYGAAKIGAWAIAKTYREHRGLWVSCGILYNHESPRRPVDFLPRKVAWHAAAIAAGEVERLVLGAQDARRDWGWAPDYMEAAWRTLQYSAADDFVIATGELHSVRDIVELAFRRVGLDPSDHVDTDEALVRPETRTAMVGDPAKARELLGWRPTRTFDEMIEEMVDADVRSLAQSTTGRTGAQ